LKRRWKEAWRAGRRDAAGNTRLRAACPRRDQSRDKKDLNDVEEEEEEASNEQRRGHTHGTPRKGRQARRNGHLIHGHA